jgi:hypothetical protein
VALSQIANVGPDMGQGYIVDSFMVVVLGGVGQLAGAVWAALGLGVVTKFLEGWAGAVIAKIVVLVFIIIFIQKRPQGLFALKGRFVELSGGHAPCAAPPLPSPSVRFGSDFPPRPSRRLAGSGWIGHRLRRLAWCWCPWLHPDACRRATRCTSPPTPSP